MKLEINKFIYPTILCYHYENYDYSCKFYFFVCYQFKFKIFITHYSYD